MREAVSSTELLHERAMERFYRAVAVEEAVDEAKREIQKEKTTESKANRDSVNSETFDKYPLFEHRTSLRKKLHLGTNSLLWQAKRDRRRSSDSQTDTLRVPMKLVPGVLEDVASDPNLNAIDSWDTRQLNIEDSEQVRNEEMNRTRYSGKVRTQYSGQVNIDYEQMNIGDYSGKVDVMEYSEEVDRVQYSGKYDPINYSGQIDPTRYSDEIDPMDYSEQVDPADYSEQTDPTNYSEVDQNQYFGEVDGTQYSDQMSNLQHSEPLRRWHDFSSENTFSPIKVTEDEDNQKTVEETWEKKPYEEITETQSVETSIESSEEESSDEDLRQFRARILAIPIENEEDTYHPRGNPVRHVSPEKPPPIPPHRVQVIDPSPDVSDRIQYSVPSPPMSPTPIVPKSILKKRVEPDVVPVNQFGRPIPPEKPIEIVRPQEDEVNPRNQLDVDRVPELTLSESDIDNENVLSAAEVARNRRRQLKQLSKSSVTSSDGDEEREEERMAVVSHYTELVKEYSMNHNPFPPRRAMTPTYTKSSKINLEEVNKSLQKVEARTLSPPRARFDYSSDERSSDNSSIYRDRNIVHQGWRREVEVDDENEVRSRKSSFTSSNAETKKRGRSRVDESSAPRSRNVSSDRGASSRSSSKTRKTDQSARNLTTDSKYVERSITVNKSSRQSSRSNSRDRSRAQTPTEAKMERLQRTHAERKQRSRRISTHDRYEPIDSYSQNLLAIQAERNVRSTFSYVTDVILLMAALYVYIFKQAILAIPIIGLILYRRIQQGIRDLIPKWLRGPKR